MSGVGLCERVMSDPQLRESCRTVRHITNWKARSCLGVAAPSFFLPFDIEFDRHLSRRVSLALWSQVSRLG